MSDGCISAAAKRARAIGISVRRKVFLAEFPIFLSERIYFS
jgi:hypothetical protein